jgi:hypothetical protein
MGFVSLTIPHLYSFFRQYYLEATLINDFAITPVSLCQHQQQQQQQQQQQSAGDFDIPSYSHQEVDRFAVLLDLWSNHAAFLECKREVRQGIRCSTKIMVGGSPIIYK